MLMMRNHTLLARHGIGSRVTIKLKIGDNVMSLGISDAVELVSRVWDLVKAGATMELKEKVMELREAILNGKDENLRLRQDNQELREKLATLESRQSRTSDYELVRAPGGAMVYRYKKEPPHFACPACIERDNISVLQDRRVMSGSWECPTCKNHYAIDPRRPPPPPVVV
jgi:hypothetical protein